MTPLAYYNEYDKQMAAWLRELIAAGLIAPGDVDERSIEDVTPNDLLGYTQCHFFAGIGGWSYALRLAGWPDDRPVWTGSCPCQPFSAAGKGGGFADERHLWPAFHWLIRQCRPGRVYGEQVASKDGLAWIDLVSTDLENEAYTVGSMDTCSAGIGATDIRQRLYWVAHTASPRPQGRRHEGDTRPGREGCAAERGGEDGGLADVPGSGRRIVGRGGIAGQGHPGSHPDVDHQRDRPGPTYSHWADPDWLHCRDGFWRPVEAGTFPLATGIPARMGRLRGYGNAINPWVAKAFIEVAESCLQSTPR